MITALVSCQTPLHLAPSPPPPEVVVIEKKVPVPEPVVPPAPTSRKELLEWHVQNVDGLLEKREEKTKP